MRQHARFASLAPKIDPERYHRIVAAENLFAARLDPGFSARLDNYGLLDLAFARDGEIAMLPFVLVHGMFLYFREGSPFVWPDWMPPIRRERLAEVETLLEPWIASLTMARYFDYEAVKYFGADAGLHAEFERAREYGFMGAAPTEIVLKSIAPYVYALRFSKDARVGVFDRNGATGAAILARVAGVDAELVDAQRAQAAARWFGLPIYHSAPAGATYDVTISDNGSLPDAPIALSLDSDTCGRAVSVALPIPKEVMVSFDPADSVEAFRFSVKAVSPVLRDRPAPVVPIVGGSTGRIGLVVRDDYAATDDADSDAAAALAERLNEQGFSARVVGASHVQRQDFDLLHVIGHRCADAFLAAVSRGEGRDVPIVFSPYADDPKSEAVWGAGIHADSLTNSADEAIRDYYLDAIAQRRLTAQGVPDMGTSSVTPAAKALLARAKAAVVSSADEADYLRAHWGFTGFASVAPALLGHEATPMPEGVGAMVGTGDFAFVHAPLDPRCNQYLIARACARLGYSLVLAGPIVDVAFHGEVYAALGDRGVYLPVGSLAAGELSALYRRARVVIDASWWSNGLYRLMRAAAMGAALVAPSSGYARMCWPGLVRLVDPASAESVAAGIRAAWERAGVLGPALASQAAERYEPFAMLKAVLAAYGQAAADADS